MISVVANVLQSVWLVTGSTTGVGFTVISKLSVGPEQPFAEGVTVMVAVTGALPVLVAVNDGMFPLPAAARPMEASVFVQL